MIVNRISDLHGFLRLQAEWTELIQHTSDVSANLTWEWVNIWLKYFEHEGELYILTARDETTGKLLGIAPLFKTKEKPKYHLPYWQIGFIGASHHHELLNFIIRDGHKNTVLNEFMRALKEGQSAWDVLQFSGVKDKKLYRRLKATHTHWSQNSRQKIISPNISLPANYEDWLMHTISKNHRKKLRKYRRQLDGAFPGAWSIHRVADEEELAEIFKVLVQYHQAQWEAAGMPGAFHYGEWSEYFFNVMKELLQMGLLRLFYLQIQEKPASILFSYKFGSHACDYISGIDYSVTDIPIGHVLTHHSIQTAIEEGLTDYCFMWGDQEYKYSFGAQQRTLHTFELIQSPRVRLQKALVQKLRQTKHLLAKQHTATKPM